MDKQQLTQKMKAKMDLDFQEFTSHLTKVMSDEALADLVTTTYTNAYRSGMDNMFNTMKDELLAEFA